MSRFKNIMELVSGNTPVVRINRLAPPHVNLYVKVDVYLLLRLATARVLGGRTRRVSGTS